MASLMHSFLNKKVLVMTADSRVLQGILASVDNQTNCVLQSAIERILNEPGDPLPSTEIQLGLYLVRGDNVCTIGLVDEEMDNKIDWSEVKGSPFGGIKHV